MAYGSSNPPNLVAQRMAGGPALWLYASTHTNAEACASNFFSNGYDLGMRVGDFLMLNQSSSSAFSFGLVVDVNTSSAATIIGTATSS
jgi:hypothetical protein